MNASFPGTTTTKIRCIPMQCIITSTNPMLPKRPTQCRHCVRSLKAVLCRAPRWEPPSCRCSCSRSCCSPPLHHLDGADAGRCNPVQITGDQCTLCWEASVDGEGGGPTCLVRIRPRRQCPYTRAAARAAHSPPHTAARLQSPGETWRDSAKLTNTSVPHSFNMSPLKCMHACMQKKKQKTRMTRLMGSFLLQSLF